MNYTSKLKQYVEEAVKNTNEANAVMKRVETEYKDGKISGNEYQKMKNQLKEAINENCTDALLKIQEIKNEHHTAVDTWESTFTLNNDDLQILNENFSLNEKQLQAIADRNKDSVLMLQAVQKYSDKNSVYVNAYQPSGDIRKQEFEKTTRDAYQSIKSGDSLKTALFLETMENMGYEYE